MSSDELAVIRTHLADELTFLSYVRSALAFLAAGAGMIHFFPSPILHCAGWSLLVVGSAIFFIGLIRFIGIKGRIQRNH